MVVPLPPGDWLKTREDEKKKRRRLTSRKLKTTNEIKLKGKKEMAEDGFG